MTAGQIFNLNNPIAPCFIKALYWVALILIALGLVRGVVGGVRIMRAPPPIAMTAADAAAPTPGDQGAMMMRGPRRDGMMHRGPDMRHRFERGPFMMGGPLLRDLPPPVLGGLRIIFALLRAAVMLMIVRVLAEIGIAILAMGAKAKA